MWSVVTAIQASQVNHFMLIINDFSISLGALKHLNFKWRLNGIMVNVFG
jgi:hypothetical protein